MAEGKKLGDLTQISTLVGTEILYLVKAGIDYKITLNQIKGFIGNATNVAAGLMSATDKVKLNGIANGATANASDDYLLNLANATGSLPVSQLSGGIDYTTLQNRPDLAALGNYTNLSNRPIDATSGAVLVPTRINVAASGSTQSDATPVSGFFIQVTGVTANSADGVRLSISTVNNYTKIRNASSVALKVYPPVGMTINSQAVNAPLSVPANTTVELIVVSAAQIMTTS